MSVRTARAELDDLDALVPLFDGYRRFYAQPSDPDGARVFLADRLKRGESVIFLAVIEGVIVGFTQLYPSFSSVSMKPLWVLNDLFVAPEARSAGVGRALLERPALGRRDRREGPDPRHADHQPHRAAPVRSVRWSKDDEFVHYDRFF